MRHGLSTLEMEEMHGWLEGPARPLRWVNRAECQNVGSEIFFVGPGETVFAAKFLCERCPVRMDCLEFCLRTSTANTDHGIFGGLTSAERAVLRTELREVV